MERKEKEKLIKAIDTTDVRRDTKNIVKLLIKLASFDKERTLRMVIDNQDSAVAKKMIDEELMLPVKEVSPEFVEFLLDEIEFSDKVREEFSKSNLYGSNMYCD